MIFILFFAGCGKGVVGNDRVVLIVCDGLRPDSVNPKQMPTLCGLADEGVRFANHRSIYLSSTNANGAALVTGAYSNRNGLLANNEYRPAFDPLQYIITEQSGVVDRGDELSGGHYLRVPTLPELFQHAGYRTVVAGAKGVTLLLDRKAGAGSAASRDSVTLERDESRPESAVNSILEELGKWPERVSPNNAQDEWVTKALIEHLWARDVPKFSMLWLAEPDYSQHSSEPGSPVVLEAIKSSDQCIAMVLRALEDRGIRERTDVIVVSDHGFSTIYEYPNILSALRKAGFAAHDYFEKTPKSGEIFVVNLGGSILFYVVNHDPEVTERLVSFLQQSEFSGVIATREKMEGTFTLDQLKIDTPDAPDVVLSLKWSEEKNEAGVPGILSKRIPGRPGMGIHASLSRFDLHNVMIAAGPHFRSGFINTAPSSTVDVAPTIAHICGLEEPDSMDGRVLAEVLAGATGPAKEAKVEIIEVGRRSERSEWRQYVKIMNFDGRDYLQEANGSAENHPKDSSDDRPK